MQLRFEALFRIGVSYSLEEAQSTGNSMNEPRALRAFPPLANRRALPWLSMPVWLCPWPSSGCDRRGDLWKGDFSSYYFGGAIIRDGHGGRLYERELQRAYQALIVPERGDTDELLGFNYPPHSGLSATLSREAAFYLYILGAATPVDPLVLFRAPSHGRSASRALARRGDGRVRLSAFVHLVSTRPSLRPAARLSSWICLQSGGGVGRSGRRAG